MKDATIEVISKVTTHPNADRLDLVQILGYQCVAQRGLYTGGEKIVYIRPDAVLPEKEWTVEYRKYSPKRIKAVRLRNEWSEGIIVPFHILPIDLSDRGIGEDVSDVLEVFHWEPPVPQDLQAKGYLPFGIPKTDEERWENIVDELPLGEKVDVTLKVDGQSCSFYYNVETDEFGVLGRSLEMKIEAVNNYTSHVTKYGIREKLEKYCKEHKVSLVIRGESYGSGIQSFEGNPHSKTAKGWAMFSVWDMNDRTYYRKGSQHYFKTVAEALHLPMVTILEEDVELTRELISKYSVGVEKVNDQPFEGVVINYSTNTFKVINKAYDSKK